MQNKDQILTVTGLLELNTNAFELILGKKACSKMKEEEREGHRDVYTLLLLYALY